MIDIHSHVLYGIDDGSKSIDESLSILEKLREIGFSSVVATPHYILGSTYIADNQKKIELSMEIYKKLKEQKSSLRLYLGNEVYIFDEMEAYIEKEEICTINDTRYILVELPFHSLLPNLDVYIQKLRENDLIPIIAHPERYAYFQKNPKAMLPLLESGALFQSNFGSAAGMYGSSAEETLFYLLKHHMIQFLATDMHKKESSFYETFPIIQKKILKYISENEWKNLTQNNPFAVLHNEAITVSIPDINEKDSFFAKFFKK